MARCSVCGNKSRLITRALGVCADCIRGGKAAARKAAAGAHARSRRSFGLPEEAPRGGEAACHVCANECAPAGTGMGYCGVRSFLGNRWTGGTPKRGSLSYYYDNLPTNCVADWVCAGGTGAGYPKYANTDGPEYGWKNLAVFYHGCSFDCLFCQNWHYRLSLSEGGCITAAALASQVDNRTSCICYFGGDPTPQMAHAIAASRLALDQNPDRPLRICWETNGSMNPRLMEKALELSVESGGCVKFDLKAWDENIHTTLCGVSNRRTLENFRLAAGWTEKRKAPPLLTASTLLVPGYVDEQEVRPIAKFIASLDPDIPYSLLGFHGDFEMTDLPATSAAHAERCENAALEEGLTRVRVGNVHVLSKDY